MPNGGPINFTSITCSRSNKAPGSGLLASLTCRLHCCTSTRNGRILSNRPKSLPKILGGSLSHPPCPGNIPGSTLFSAIAPPSARDLICPCSRNRGFDIGTSYFSISKSQNSPRVKVLLHHRVQVLRRREGCWRRGTCGLSIAIYRIKLRESV